MKLFPAIDIKNGQCVRLRQGKFHNVEPDNPETDLYWTDRGYASVVPCRPDQSAVNEIGLISDLLG